MSWLKGMGTELVALFVDDGQLALLTVVWLIACGLVLPRLHLSPALPPAILFIGLLVILARSALGRASRGR